MSALRAPFSVEHLVARVLLAGGLFGIALVVLALGSYAAHGGFYHHVLRLNRTPRAIRPGSSCRSGR